jgi:hypothetical protein
MNGIKAATDDLTDSPTVIFLRRLDFAVQATGCLDGTKHSKVAVSL